MKLHRNPLFVKFGGLVGSAMIRSWMSSLDCRVAYYDPTVDPVPPLPDKATELPAGWTGGYLHALEWRLAAYRHWRTMTEPNWSSVDVNDSVVVTGVGATVDAPLLEPHAPYSGSAVTSNATARRLITCII